MGTGYTRQSEAEIATGLTIDAADFNAEFDAIESAFDASTGHSHDGTSGEGPQISLTAGVTGVLPVANGGTNASTIDAARINLLTNKPHFATRAAAQAGQTGTATSITVLDNNYVLEYIYDASGTALTTGDSRTWSPAGEYTLLHFGADPTNTNDSTTAINAALATGKNIFGPDGRYKITSTLSMSTRGQALYGRPGSDAGKGDNTGDDYGFILEFSIDDGAAADAMVSVTQSQCSFRFVKFIGDTGNAVDIGIEAAKASNTDDMDISITNCEFYNLKSPIKVKGRGLYTDGNLFSNVGNGDAILHEWPASGESGDDIQTDPLYEGRAIRVINNRLHGSGTLYVINGFKARSPIISGNMMDVGNAILRVDNGGGVLNGFAADNIADLCNKSVFDFGAASTCKNFVISGGSYGGAAAGTVDGDDHRPFAVVRFNGPAELDGLHLDGVAIHDTDAFAVAIINDAAETPITPENISINGCAFSGVGADGSANRAVFYSIFGVTGFSYNNNSHNDLGATVTALIRSNSVTFTDVTARGNRYDDALPLFGATTLAGNIDVDHKQGGYSVTTNGVFRVGNLGAYNGSLPFQLNRENSASGVGANFANSAGNISLYGTPTGVNAGSFSPGVDDAVDWGTSAARWANSYVVTRYWTSSVWDGYGSGSPEGVYSAAVGSTYRRTDASTNFNAWYWKASGTGNTGWISLADILAGAVSFGGNVTLGDASTDVTTVTGRMQVIAGTLASPGIRASVDTDTGLQLDTSAVRVVTSSTLRATFDDNGLTLADNSLVISTAKTPASASDTGTTGEISWDTDYIYVCTATNTWKRAALSTW